MSRREKPSPLRLRDRRLLDEIDRLADGEEPPTKRQMREEGRYSCRPYTDRWGRWNNALAAAGYDRRQEGGG